MASSRSLNYFAGYRNADPGGLQKVIFRRERRSIFGLSHPKICNQLSGSVFYGPHLIICDVLRYYAKHINILFTRI
jgi:hypothetical protein